MAKLLTFDKFLLHAAKQSTRLFTQIRCLPTARFISKQDLVKLVQPRLADEDLVRLRCLCDPGALTIQALESIDATDHVKEMHTSTADGPQTAMNAILGMELPSDRPLWDIVSYTDGADNHGVMFRWNHWMGDGISTQAVMARLFDYDFAEPASIASRVHDLENVTWGDRLDFWKLMLSKDSPVRATPFEGAFGLKQATSDTEFVDRAAVICMPVSP